MRQGIRLVLLLILTLTASTGLIYVYYPEEAYQEALEKKMELDRQKGIAEDFELVRTIIDGQMLFTEVPSRIKDNHVLIPLRATLQGLNYNINWDNKKRLVRLEYEGTKMQFVFDVPEAKINRKNLDLMIAPMEVQGVSLVPAALLEVLGITVSWDENNRVINVDTPNQNAWPFKVSDNSKITVLMYHEVGDGPNNLFVRDSEFKEQMKYLWDNNYQVVSMDEALNLLKNNQNVDKCVVITFDDGYRTFFTKAWPILREYRFPATVYAISDKCVNNPRYLEWEQMRFLQANWIDIGSHTKSHPDLTGLSPESMADEIAGSKKVFEDNLYYPCRHFCYPGGALNDKVVKMVETAGYESAVTIQNGYASSKNNILLLPRVRIPRDTAISYFAQLIK
ncbi:MAG: polysaccharide deacetylase family protein [Syntrophomonadaceae bacterium]|nr:polysaccharide deacetylase family protein [Syntrophomonadaceae bacterium]